MVDTNRNYTECHKPLKQGKRFSKHFASEWSDNEEMYSDCCEQVNKQKCLYYIHKLLILLEILTISITFLSPFLILALPNIHPSWWFSLLPPSAVTSTPSISPRKVMHIRSKINANSVISRRIDRRTEVYYEVKIIELCTKILLLFLCSSYIYATRFKELLFCMHNRKPFISYSRLTGYKRYQQSEMAKTVSSIVHLSWPQSKIKQSLAFNFFIDSITVIVTFSFWLIFLSHWKSDKDAMTLPNDSDESLNYKSKPCGYLQHTVQLTNPFGHRDPGGSNLCDETKRIYIDQQLSKLKTIALDLSVDFVNVHLSIQLTAILLIKFKTILDWLSCKYNVHVVRAQDGFSYNYKIGSVNLKSIANYIIKNALVDFKPYDPLLVRQKRNFRYSQSIYSDCIRNTINSTSNCNKLRNMAKSEYKEMKILKPKLTSSTQAKTYCHPTQFIKALHNNNPLRFRYDKNSTVSDTAISGLTDNSINKTDLNDAESNVDDEYAEDNPPKSCETFDFFKMPDIYELNVQAAKRLKSEISYLKYKRKCQIRLTALITDLFNTVYTKSDFSVNAVDSSSENQLQKSIEYVFQKLFGPVCKYLRLTKQHTYHTRGMILNRLKIYLQYNMSAESFLSVYFNPPSELFHLQCYHHQCNDKVNNPRNNSQNYRYKICQNDTNLLKFEKTYSTERNVNNALEQSGRNKNIKKEFNSNTKVFQTWKLRLCDPLINASVYDGFRFELVRSDMRLFCVVKQFSMLQLIKANVPIWWSGITYERSNIILPPSTVETCIGSSENMAEIKL
ncbi:unnamed protein product [Schistosoma rodhaini]|uniref:Uncharacterized protein n=1 Tax=Schistosoma rodhaini TaxID=6188 RepID=A0AA85FG82_9TREM|nr:unnamed protein product [Schistosoma rodhaini]